MVILFRGTTVQEALFSPTVGRHWTDNLYVALEFAFSHSGGGVIHKAKYFFVTPRGTQHPTETGGWRYSKAPNLIQGAIVEIDIPEEFIVSRYSDMSNPWAENEYLLKMPQLPEYDRRFSRKFIRKIHIITLKKVQDTHSKGGGIYVKHSSYALDKDGKRIPDTYTRSGHRQQRDVISFLSGRK